MARYGLASRRVPSSPFITACRLRSADAGGAPSVSVLAPSGDGLGGAPNSPVSRRRGVCSCGRVATATSPASSGGRGRGRRPSRPGRIIAGARTTTIAGLAASSGADPALIRGTGRCPAGGLSAGRRCLRAVCSPRSPVALVVVGKGLIRGLTAEGRSGRRGRRVAP